MWLSFHAIQKVHKVNYNITSTMHCNLPEMFPIKNGISSDLIPGAKILGSPNTYYNKLIITYEEYTLVYIGTTNSTNCRTVGEIALSPANEWGRHYFMSIATGEKLHTYI